MACVARCCGAMTKLMPWLFVVVLFAGCRHVDGPLVVVAGAGDAPCVDRVVTRAREAGYVETAVDRNTGFVRVEMVAPRSGKRIRKVLPDGRPNRHFFSAQCSPDGATASISAVDDLRGSFDERAMPSWLRKEMEAFALVIEGY